MYSQLHIKRQTTSHAFIFLSCLYIMSKVWQGCLFVIFSQNKYKANCNHLLHFETELKHSATELKHQMHIVVILQLILLNKDEYIS